MSFFKKKQNPTKISVSKFKPVNKTITLKVKTQVVVFLLKNGEKRETTIESRLHNGYFRNMSLKTGLEWSWSVDADPCELVAVVEPTDTNAPESYNISLMNTVISFFENGIQVEIRGEDVKEIRKLPVQTTDRTYQVNYKVLERHEA